MSEVGSQSGRDTQERDFGFSRNSPGTRGYSDRSQCSSLSDTHSGHGDRNRDRDEDRRRDGDTDTSRREREDRERDRERDPTVPNDKWEERDGAAELGMWRFYAAGASIEPPLRLGYSVAERFVVGERVRRRDHGKAWGEGYVTSTAPLRVTLGDAAHRHIVMLTYKLGRNGFHWDEVQKLTASVSGQSMSAFYSAASASEPRLWAAYRLTRGSLAQRYEQAAERRREGERREGERREEARQVAWRNEMDAAQNRRQKAEEDKRRAEHVCMTKCYSRSSRDSTVVPPVCLVEPLLWLDYGSSSSQCNALRAVESLSPFLPRVLEEWREVVHLAASKAHKQGTQIEPPAHDVLEVAAALLQADNDVSDEELRALFDMFDKDGDVKLSQREYVRYLRQIGVWGSRPEYESTESFAKHWPTECSAMGSCTAGVTWAGFQNAYSLHGSWDEEAMGARRNHHDTFMQSRAFAWLWQVRSTAQRPRLERAAVKVLAAKQSSTTLALFMKHAAALKLCITNTDTRVLQTALCKALESGQSLQQAVMHLLQAFEELGRLLEVEATRQQIPEPEHVLQRVSIAQIVATRHHSDVQRQLRDAVFAWKHERQPTEIHALTSSGIETEGGKAEIVEEKVGPRQPSSPAAQRTPRRDAQSVLVRVSGHPNQLVSCEYTMSRHLHAGHQRFESKSGCHLYFCPELAGWVLNDVWEPAPAMDTNGVQAYLRAAGLGGWYKLLRKKLPHETMGSVEAVRAVRKSMLEQAASGCGVWMVRQLEAACAKFEEALEPFLEARGYESHADDLRATGISTPAQLLAITEGELVAVSVAIENNKRRLKEYAKSCGLEAWVSYFINHTCDFVITLLSAAISDD
jgi:hypothetical protein